MKNTLNDQPNGILEKPSEALQEMLWEYIMLSTKTNLTASEEERLDEILNQAEEDDQLAFWVVVMDARISENCGLLKPEHYRSYEEQHEKLVARLSEHIDISYEVQEEVIASSSGSNGELRIYPADIENIFVPGMKRFMRKNCNH